ncbi:MAG: hypothetical protein ABJN35_03355 [Erythrobacter sp.]
MPNQPDEILATELQIALAHTPPKFRDALRIFFELDHRLSRIVAATTEPMLGQMRLAWWRDMLGKPIEERPHGDAVLDGIGAHWLDRESALIKLVDAWEHMLAPAPMGKDDALGFVNGRSAGLLAALNHDQHGSVAWDAAAWVWAFADMASKVSLDEERELMVDLGRSKEPLRARLSKPARGLAVLGTLGARALNRGARPLMEGRAASLLATRAAIIGK